MQWTSSPQHPAVFELVDESRGGPPLARLGFVTDDRAAAEIAPALLGQAEEGRFVFAYMDDPKLVRVLDGRTGDALGQLSLAWNDSGKLSLVSGERLVWEYTGLFSKARQWVDASGKVLVRLEAPDLPKPTAVKLEAPSRVTPLLLALGWFVMRRRDWSAAPDLVTRGGPLAWGLPAPKLAWSGSLEAEPDFDLRLGDELVADLKIVDATTGSGTMKPSGAFTLHLAPRDGATRRLEVKNGETKETVATMAVDAAYNGHLDHVGARYAWDSVTIDDKTTWSFTGPDGRLILAYADDDDIELALELHGEHPRASFLALVGFFLLAMKHAEAEDTLLGVTVARDAEGHEPSTTSGGKSGVTVGDAVDVADAIIDLLD